MGHLGETLRAIREQGGITLTTMAALTHYTKSYLSMAETGARPVTPAIVDAYCHALRRDQDMHRRTILRSLLAGAAAPEQMFDSIRAGYEHALNTAPPHADEWAARTETYGRDYMSTGSAQLQARLARDLIQLQTHLDSPQMWATAARLLTVHGKTIPSAGATTGALHWYRTAARAADRSGDPETRVWVRGRAALALAYEGAELPAASVLAAQALALAPRPSLGTVNAHMALAHVAGHAGDRTTALTAMTHGQRAFDTAGSDEQISDFAVPLWRMETFRSMLLSRLGDPAAAAAQDAADRYRPAELPRFAVHIELHRALALARSGDRAGGRDYAQAAYATLTPERRSLSLRLMMAEIEHATT